MRLEIVVLSVWRTRGWCVRLQADAGLVRWLAVMMVRREALAEPVAHTAPGSAGSLQVFNSAMIQAMLIRILCVE